ncbi:MAG: S24 family peptidase [Candidatus Riflebacteria bacterium]|nr:S24 family peptidase [Candidatus Riflebacteria bacterium]
MATQKKTKKKRIPKRTFLLKELERLLFRQKLRIVDIANNSFLPISTLSNVFSGLRLPSDELLHAIGRGMNLPKNEIAKLFLYLAQARTSGSAQELWIDLVKCLESPQTAGFYKSNLGNYGTDGSFIPIYETVWPSLKLGVIEGSQIGIFPYWEEKAKSGAFGLLVPDDSMDGPDRFLKTGGLAVFESQKKQIPPFGNICCIHLPGEERCKIRRILKDPDGKIIFQPDNPRYKAVSYSADSQEVFFYGILEGFWKFSNWSN